MDQYERLAYQTPEDTQSWWSPILSERDSSRLHYSLAPRFIEVKAHLYYLFNRFDGFLKRIDKLLKQFEDWGDVIVHLDKSRCEGKA